MRMKLKGAMLAALLAGMLGAGTALACGGFFRSRATTVSERTPSLAYEQTLIVFDDQAGREHFVREVVFRDSAEPFGFVVPTPARPSVHAVKKSPFKALQESFPFGDEPEPRAGGAARAGGVARSIKSAKVEVLEERQVGSFRSFVLAATDGQALSTWLSENGFASTPSTEAWLAHYVKLKFFYVAMRYQPKADDGKTAAETVRISFDTPLPYYPYLEPEHEPGQPAQGARLLDVWLVASRTYAPVALDERGARWVRPLESGRTIAQPADPRPSLLSALPADRGILPGGELVVQRFADQKKSRAGFGDVVFVPVGAPALSDAQRAKLVPLAGLLDPSLVGGP